jgi:DNA-directed RNA polymerase subunit K/omega
MSLLPQNIGQFEFAVLASRRVAQLMRGCAPRCPHDGHKATTVARLEVSSGQVVRVRGVIGTPLDAAGVPANIL